MTTPAPFTFKERLGITLIVEAAGLSALAVSILLIYIAWNAWTSRSHPERCTNETRPIHYLFLNLMVFDLIQAVGGLISARWVAEAAVIEGPVCMIQGALKQAGNVGVALTSFALALHTFFVLVFRVRPSWWIPSATVTSFLTIAAIWIFIACVVGFGAGLKGIQRYYTNTGYWCWINSDFLPQRITLEYLWLWSACFANIIIYGCIFLVFRGFIVTGDSNRLSIGRGTTSATRFGASAKNRKTLARQVLFYPAVYTITVFPISVLRWLQFRGTKIPFEATVVCSILFALSGALNVILFSVTRPSVVRRPRPVTERISTQNLIIPHSPQSLTFKRGTFQSAASVRFPDTPRVRTFDPYGMNLPSPAPTHTTFTRFVDDTRVTDDSSSEESRRSRGAHV